MRKILVQLVLFCLPLFALAQISVKQVFVAESTVKCGLQNEKNCLQIRESESDPWRVLREEIKGFKYKKGYRYVIELQSSIEKNTMTGQTTASYTLNRVISQTKYKQTKPAKPVKEKKEKEKKHEKEPKKHNESSTTQENKPKEVKNKPTQLAGKKWYLVKIYDGQKFIDIKDQSAFIEFDKVNGRVNGNTGCNGFFGEATYKNNSFTTKGIGSTRMYCNNKMEIESLLLNYLKEVNTLELENGQVKLFKNNAILMILE